MEDKSKKCYDKRTYEERKQYLLNYQKERYQNDVYYRRYILDYNAKYSEKNKEILKEKRKIYNNKPEIREKRLAYQKDYYKRVLKPKILENQKNNMQNNKNDIN